MIVNGNALYLPIANGTVQTCITSPPYWALRDYGQDGQLGLEKTPEEYVSNMVAVFREVWRVLRDDGTVWLNLGDSYAGNKDGNTNGTGAGGLATGKVQQKPGVLTDGFKKILPDGLKSKDLVGIPWRVAFALQADGWYLRSDIIWSKPNPMPESVTDRPTKAHEYLFLLAKAPHYYFDQDAIREPHAEATLPRAKRGVSDKNKWVEGAPGSTAHTMSQPRPNIKNATGTQVGAGSSFANGHSGYYSPDGRLLVNPMGRNIRTVWTIPTQSTSFAHFATFPEKLVEPCILAGTSERGACPKCGKPWERVAERQNESNWEFRKTMGAVGGSMQEGNKQQIGAGWSHDLPTNNSITIGWQPSCTCDAGDPIPCLVLDPFAGSGTVERVAIRHSRRFIGTELKYAYINKIASQRTSNIQIALFGALPPGSLDDATRHGK